MKKEQFSWLRCGEGRILDECGRQFLPLGFGVGGALFPEGYMWQVFGGKTNREKNCEAPTWMYRALCGLVGEKDADAFWRAYLRNWLTREDVLNMGAWGCNHIRLPLTYKTLTDRPGHYLEEGFAEVERICQWSREAGMYIVLDLHAAPGGPNMWHWCDSDGSARMWEEPEAYWDWNVDIWREIARRYKDDPSIMGYDLLNEPVLPPGHTNHELRELSRRITEGIRQVDDRHMVIIEGDKCSRDFTDMDPFDDNMAYSFHLYKYGGPPPLQEELTQFLSLREKTGCPLWNGETGDNGADWWEADIELHMKNEIGICMWTHKKIVNANQPYVAELDPGFREIAQYISERGPKPDEEMAREALVRQAEAMKTENCRFQPEFLRGFTRYGKH